MSIKDVIARFEGEKAEIQEKMEALRKRDEVLDVLINELNAAARGDKGKAGAAKTKSKKLGRPRGKKKGGMTVREGIMGAVAEAKKPVTAGEIIEKAVASSGGAEASIRTQINVLTKLGSLEQLPYEGRGFKYQISKPKKAAPKPKKARAKARKPAAKPAPKAEPKPE